MTPEQAASYGWVALVPVIGFVMLLSTYLLGLSILRGVGR